MSLDELVTESGRGESRSKIDGVRNQMRKMNRPTYCGVLLCETIFAPCEDLAKALQSEKTTATGAAEAAKVLLTQFEKD